MWLVFSIITVLCWGVSIAALKRSYQTLTPIMWIIMGAVASVAILLPYALFNDPSFIFWPLIPISIFITACYALFAYAMDKGQISLVATVESVYPLVTVILASFFLHEATSIFVKLGVVIIIFGLVFLSINNPKDIRSIKIGQWFFWGIAAALTTGLAGFLSKVMVSTYSTPTYLVGFVIGEVIVAVILSLFDRKNIKPITFNKDNSYMILSAITLYLGYLFFFLAFSKGLASLVTPISGTYAMVTFLLAITWLKEKVNRFQLTGAVLTILGAIVVSSF
jgi:uncharacterized membrane protein